MNKNEAKLVKALRSGRYKQTTGRLRSFDRKSYCCLGVACLISRLGKYIGNEFVRFEGTAREESEDSCLTQSVLHWLGWSSKDGRTNFKTRSNYRTFLSSLNDDGLTFDQIADLIEAGQVQTKEDEANETS